jgi:type IV pilus assembly protein PilW
MSRPQQHKLQQAGFSLIELMIAVTLGLLIMTALVALFVNTSRTNQEMAKTNSQIENARFALNVLSDDLMHGGYWGGYIPVFDDLTSSAVPTDAPTAIPAPCTAYSSWDATYIAGLIGIPLQFYNGVPTGCSSIVTNKQASTDVVVVRHADTCALIWNATTSAFEPEDTNCDADLANAAYFQTSRCETDASRYVLGTTGFSLQRRQCDSRRAPRYRLISNIYYIRNYAVTSGDGIPTLVRSELGVTSGAPAQQAAVPLVEGIEGLRIEAGIDSLSETGASINYAAAVNWQDTARKIATNRGDGIPDGSPPFAHCAGGCTATQLTNVSAARVYVLARANEATPGYTDTKTYTLGTQTLGPFNDGFKRHVFSTTVRFVNITSRRETP